MFEVFEHTADLGLRIDAANLNDLFVESAQALFSTVVENLDTIRSEVQVDVRLEEDDPSYLLFDWLNELLFQFDSKHLLFGRFEAAIEGNRLVGTAWGEPIDRARHVLDHEIKAITYHGLTVEKSANGWRAEVIVDI